MHAERQQTLTEIEALRARIPEPGIEHEVRAPLPSGFVAQRVTR